MKKKLNGGNIKSQFLLERVRKTPVGVGKKTSKAKKKKTLEKLGKKARKKKQSGPQKKKFQRWLRNTTRLKKWQEKSNKPTDGRKKLEKGMDRT